eukprot:5953973-Amphidinium_carterae.1
MWRRETLTVNSAEPAKHRFPAPPKVIVVTNTYSHTYDSEPCVVLATASEAFGKRGSTFCTDA